MNNKFITVRDLIEILNKVNPNLEVVIEHNNPDYDGVYCGYPTVYYNVEPIKISIKDDFFVLDISH